MKKQDATAARQRETVWAAAWRESRSAATEQPTRYEVAEHSPQRIITAPAVVVPSSIIAAPAVTVGVLEAGTVRPTIVADFGDDGCGRRRIG
ncbi:hypothetical protein AB0H00_25520 [Nocardia sp. NPDC023852]|uniref:hypothetical protein n=1 Tax=Nocardia sp. NPDC023852 TaxID=3154697 RepID=UPI0033CD8270